MRYDDDIAIAYTREDLEGLTPEDLAQEAYIPLSEAREIFKDVYDDETLPFGSDSGMKANPSLPQKDHLSHSSLERLRCNRQFWLNIHEFPSEIQHPEAEEGAENHAAIEAWLKGDINALDRHFNQKTASAIRRLLSRFLPPEHPERNGKGYEIDRLLVEHEVLVKVDSDLPPVLGRIDLVAINSHKAFVIDHKSGGGNNITDKELRQLKRYAALLYLNGDIDGETEIELLIHRIGRKLISAGVVKPKEAAEEFKAELESEKEHILSLIRTEEEPQPSPGPHCQYCPYIFSCPLNHLIPTTESELAAVAIVSHYKAEAVKKLLPPDSPIELPDVLVGYTLTEIESVKANAVSTLLKLLLNGVLTVTQLERVFSAKAKELKRLKGIDAGEFIEVKRRRKFIVENRAG